MNWYLSRGKIAAIKNCVDEISDNFGKTRLFCTGYFRLRKALYLPAVVVMRSHPLLKAMRERFLGRGKVKMRVIGALMRKPIDPTDNDQSPID